MVPHNMIKEFFLAVELGKRIVNFKQGMYEITLLKVEICSQISEFFKYERGVRQVCKTYTRPFDIYYNSILDNIEPFNVEKLKYGLK